MGYSGTVLLYGHTEDIHGAGKLHSSRTEENYSTFSEGYEKKMPEKKKKMTTAINKSTTRNKEKIKWTG